MDPSVGRPSRLVLIGRLLLLLGAVGAVALAFALAARRDGAGVPYACPMHPEVRSLAPARCPICGMALARAGEHLRDLGPIMRRDESFEARIYDVSQVYPRKFSREVRAPAWVEADRSISALIYKDQQRALAPGERGAFVPTTAVTPGAEVVHDGAAPPVPWDDNTVLTRFRLTGDAPEVQAGDAGWITLPARPTEVVAVTYESILESEQGPSVFVASADSRSFARRPVELGQVFFGLGVVVSGLAVGEKVSVGNPFFLGAEERLRGIVTAAPAPVPPGRPVSIPPGRPAPPRTGP